MMKNLEDKLKSHDWFYNYSDDPRYYRKGSNESEVIRSLMQTAAVNGEGEEACALFNKYNPYGDPEKFGRLFEKICVSYMDDGAIRHTFMTKEEYERFCTQ